MAMSRFEKLFVNRAAKGRANIRRLERRLELLDPARIRDVLELGCGMGTVSAHLADVYPWNVTGTDVDPNQIEEARHRHGESARLRFQVEDASQLSFDDETFDLMIAQDMLHHVHHWHAVLHEARRVLRPTGHLILDELAITTLGGWLAGLFRPTRHGYTLSRLHDAFLQIGFEIKNEDRTGIGLVGRYLALLRRS